jgi:D-methionine transport system ATP-binding protein
MFHAERPLEAEHPPTHSFLDNHSRQSNSSPVPMLQLRSLSKAYDHKPVVSGVSLSLQTGVVYGVIGRSGAGKSTLLRMAALLESPDAGRTLYGGLPVSGLQGKELLLARRRAGVVFQSFNLFSSRTAEGNVAFPLEAAGVAKAAIKKRVAALLDLVGLADKAARPVGRFSGGEKQRVAIARALANEPDILFCDEATSALDPETTRSVLDLILSIRDKLGLTVLMVTHQMEVVRRVCDELAVMDMGQIVETGTVDSLFASPQTKAAKRLIAGMEIDETEPSKEASHG